MLHNLCSICSRSGFEFKKPNIDGCKVKSDFMNMAPNPQEIKEKIDIMNFIKTKKDSPQNGRKFTKHV